MALTYGSPAVTSLSTMSVTSGLVIHLDANNPSSYPGSGTTWTDLSGNGYNCTLTGTTAFNTDAIAGGNIALTAGSGHVPFAVNLSSSNNITIELLVKTPLAYNDTMYFGFLNYDVYYGGNSLGFNTAQGDVMGIPISTVSSLGIINSWKHLVFNMRDNVSYSNNKIYVDANSVGLLQQQVGAEGAGSRIFNNGNGHISGWRADAAYRMGMNIAVFKIYNRELTPKEIANNYFYYKNRLA